MPGECRETHSGGANACAGKSRSVIRSRKAGCLRNGSNSWSASVRYRRRAPALVMLCGLEAGRFKSCDNCDVRISSIGAERKKVAVRLTR